MKVWAVRECVPYEFDDIHSLWTTEKAAREKAKWLEDHVGEASDWDYMVTVQEVRVFQ